MLIDAEIVTFTSLNQRYYEFKYKDRINKKF